MAVTSPISKSGCLAEAEAYAAARESGLLAVWSERFASRPHPLVIAAVERWARWSRLAHQQHLALRLS